MDIPDDNLNKNILNRKNINNEDIITQNRKVKIEMRLEIRKKRVQNILFKKRYQNYNINPNNLSIISSSNKKEIKENNNEKSIPVPPFLIDEKLKSPETIEKIMKEENFKTIFSFINEIYNPNNFNIEKLKYGLFLLDLKLYLLPSDSVVNTLEILKYNFIDIVNKLLSYSMKEINENDSNDKILSYTYHILANFSFFAKNEEILFLSDNTFLNYHKFFLKNCSNNTIIKRILELIYNLCIVNPNTTYELFNFSNNEFVKIFEESAIKSKKNIKHSHTKIITDIYNCYINILYNNLSESEIIYKYLNINVLGKIYLDVLRLIIINENIHNEVEKIRDLKDEIFSNVIYTISSIYKILFKTNNIDYLCNIILGEGDTLGMLKYILDYDYKENPENIHDLCKIFIYLIKCDTYCNNLNIKKKIEELIDDINPDEIFQVVSNFLQESYVDKIKQKLIGVILALCENENYYRDLFCSVINPVNVLINHIYSPDYKIRKKILKAFETLTSKLELHVSNELVKNNIFSSLKNLIDPNNSFCCDEEIILMGLNIIDYLLQIGKIMQDMGGSQNNNTLICFENNGGKEMIERLMNNKSKNVYDKAVLIMNNHFNSMDL